MYNYNLFELPEDFLTHKYSDEEKAKYNNIIFDVIHSPSLNEDLTDAQKAKVDKMDTSYRGYPEHDKAFGKGVDRIVLPYDDSKDPIITSSNFRNTPKIANINDVHHHMVFDELHKGGYKVDDYLSGLTYHKDTPNRKIKIRKALENIGVADSLTRIQSKPKYKVSETGKILKDKQGNKIVDVPPKNLTLGQVYDADPVRSAAKTPKQIVITRNKYDVCGMSTDRGWSSCMNMVDGSNKHYLPKDIYHGTATAYLTKVGDDGVKNPIGRINLKKFQSTDGHVIYRAEKRQYGMIPKSFISQTDDFAKEKYPSKPGVYLKPSELYNDDGESMKMEGMDHLTHHELITHAPKIAEGIIHNGRRAMENDSNGWDNNIPEDTKSDVMDTLDKLHKDLNRTELANVVIHHIADHSYEEDGNRQSEGRTKFNDAYDLDNIDGDDSVHHWAITRLGNNYDVNKGIKEMPVDQKMVNLDKIHRGMEHTEDNDHEALKEVHASLIDSAFKDHPESTELHNKILNHMFDPKNSNYYDNLMDTNSSHLDKVHPVELTKNPRMIHHILESDTSSFNHNDVWDTKGAVEHMGEHADHKLADRVIHHEDAKQEDQSNFVEGLNKNPDGEKISHQISDDMLLQGGAYHGRGELLPITEPHQLKYAMQGGGYRSSDYVADDSTHLGKYVALAANTKFKSVYDKIKQRTETDLNHPDIKQALEDNWEMRPKKVTEDRKKFKDSISEAYSRI